jgi:hypothetical protein
MHRRIGKLKPKGAELQTNISQRTKEDETFPLRRTKNCRPPRQRTKRPCTPLLVSKAFQAHHRIGEVEAAEIDPHIYILSA